MVGAKEGNNAAFIGTISTDFTLCKENAYRASVWMSEDATIYKGDSGYFFRLAKDTRPLPSCKVAWSTDPYVHTNRIPNEIDRMRHSQDRAASNAEES
jgi:hypothetical protein